MTRYDWVAGHPLAGVPQEVLNAAREALGVNRFFDPENTDDRNTVADAVVQLMRERGYLTWPQAVPDRESLVLAVMQVQDAYRRFQDDEDVTFAERIVDALILPLLTRGEVKHDE